MAGPASLFAEGVGICMSCSLKMRKQLRAISKRNPGLSQDEAMLQFNSVVMPKLIAEHGGRECEPDEVAVELPSASERGFGDLGVETAALELQLASLEGRKNKEKRQRIREKQRNLGRAAAATEAGQRLVPGELRVAFLGIDGAASSFEGLYTLARDGMRANGEHTWYSGETKKCIFKSSNGKYVISDPPTSNNVAYFQTNSPTKPGQMPHELRWGYCISGTKDCYWDRAIAPCGREYFFNPKSNTSTWALPFGTPTTWIPLSVDAVLAETFEAVQTPAAATEDAATATVSEAEGSSKQPVNLTLMELKLKVTELRGPQNKKKRQRLLKRISALEGGAATAAAATAATVKPSASATRGSWLPEAVSQYPKRQFALARRKRVSGGSVSGEPASGGSVAGGSVSGGTVSGGSAQQPPAQRAAADPVDGLPATAPLPESTPAPTLALTLTLTLTPELEPEPEPIPAQVQVQNRGLPAKTVAVDAAAATPLIDADGGLSGFTMVASKKKGGRSTATATADGADAAAAAWLQLDSKAKRESRRQMLRLSRQLFVGNLPVGCSGLDLADCINDAMVGPNGWAAAAAATAAAAAAAGSDEGRLKCAHGGVVKATVNDDAKPFGFVEFQTASECTAALENADVFMMYCDDGRAVKYLRLERPNGYTAAVTTAAAARAFALADISSAQNIAAAVTNTNTNTVTDNTAAVGADTKKNAGLVTSTAAELVKLNRQLSAAMATRAASASEVANRQRAGLAARATLADQRSALEADARATASAAKAEEERRHRVAMALIDARLSQSIGAGIESDPAVVSAQQAADAAQTQLGAWVERVALATLNVAELEAQCHAGAANAGEKAGVGGGGRSMAMVVGTPPPVVTEAVQEAVGEEGASESESDGDDGWVTVPLTTPPRARSRDEDSDGASDSGRSSGEEDSDSSPTSSPATARRRMHNHSGPVKFTGSVLKPPLTKAEKAAKKARKVKNGASWEDEDGCGAGCRIKASNKTIAAYLKHHRWEHVRTNKHSVYRRAVDEHGVPIKQQSAVVALTPSDVAHNRNMLARLRRLTLSATPLCNPLVAL